MTAIYKIAMILALLLASSGMAMASSGNSPVANSAIIELIGGDDASARPIDPGLDIFETGPIDPGLDIFEVSEVSEKKID